jgi:ABC-type dipeptide/oligopeptide/nickel transport system permease component
MLLRYTLQRLLMLIPVSFSISVVIFMIVYLLPGDPIDNLLRVGSSPEDRAELVALYGSIARWWCSISPGSGTCSRVSSGKPSSCAARSPT